ncbi:hypothetical protein KIW84_075750 [Lathyrus oleraceus]|uniref:Uncharacterized protein n=1 Tax=Pisum sativum TaxID=3888 RepID=A0A9D4ZYH2_PEA|nr:hypothetical protein KIW84_075750 [Pisum sativum]
MSFLDGLDDRLDNIRSDVLQMKPFPTVEQAYAHVRMETLRQEVMTDNSNELSGAVLASKGLKLHSSKILSQSKHKKPSNGTKCSHCRGNKHTSETCFKLHGYPDWWTDFQARKRRDTTDRNPRKDAVASVEPHLSLIPKSSSHTTEGNVLIFSNHDDDSNAWILDSGATNHMTFDAADFSERSTPRRSSIANVNGGLSAVTGVGTVMLSPTLSLSNTLLVPSLSHKLLSTLSTFVPLPTIQMLPPRVFGCVAFGHLHKNQRTKLDLCAIRCLFLGYGVHQKGYRCYDPITRRIYVTMDVTFLEFDHFYSFVSPNSSLQGETPEEESNWSTFDWFKDIDIPSTEVFGDSCQTQTDHMSPEVEISKFPPPPLSSTQRSIS